MINAEAPPRPLPPTAPDCDVKVVKPLPRGWPSGSALEAFLADVYGRGRILHDEVVPHPIVTSSPGFLRAVHGFDPANGVRIPCGGHRRGARSRRLVQGSRGQHPLPLGVSYVLANRQAMARVLPEVFWGQPIHMVTDYPARLVQSLRQAAPAGVADPTVVVLTPACTTPRSTSTPCSPASWASILWRAGTSSAMAPTSSCGRPTARCRCT